MLKFVKGDIFAGGHDFIVCPVNNQGIMGKGLALEFKERFPEASLGYVEACSDSKYGGPGLGPGGIWFEEGSPGIFFVATKASWRNPSQLDWVHTGIVNLKGFVRRMDIQNIGIPALGCGEGGLDWDKVKKTFEFVFQDCADRNITIYEPDAPIDMIN